MERELAVFKSAEETRRMTEVLGRRRSELESLLAEWEELSQAMEDGASG